MLDIPIPDPRLMERLTARIRARQGSPEAWSRGGQAVALALLGRDDTRGLPLWAADLADTMVGSLLRVLEASLDEATTSERVDLALGAVALSVARPHCTYVLDGAVDAWTGWTPEGPCPEHGEATLSGWVLLQLLRENLDGAAETADVLRRVDSGLGMVLQDWVVARLQSHGPDREAMCFHAFRAALGATDGPNPTLLLAAAAVAGKRAGDRRRSVLPWLDVVATEVAMRGTSSVTPRAIRR